MIDSTGPLYSVDAPPVTALVIDDEAMIRRIIRRTLEPAVCRVVEAESAEEGLCMVQRGTPPIDFIFTDVHLPGLDGWDVAQVLATYRPGLPVVMLSSDQDAAMGHTRPPGVRFLAKPFTCMALTAVALTLADLAQTNRVRETPWRPIPIDLITAARELHGRIRH